MKRTPIICISKFTLYICYSTALIYFTPLSSSLSSSVFDIDQKTKSLSTTTTLSKRTNSCSTTNPKSFNTIHLISLPPLLSDDTSPKLIKDIWKWKDIVLGDGRDYFIPRPRALKALSDILIGSSLTQSISDNDDVLLHHGIEECAILSNCARMDVLLCLQTNVTTYHQYNCQYDQNENHSKNDMESRIHDSIEEASKVLVANCIMNQLTAYQRIKKEKGGSAIIWEGLSSFFDLPGMVSMTDVVTNGGRNENSQGLSELLISSSQLDEIILHFCNVAAGLAKRDSRPDRPVTFRPFSSRDAHIMLQLKRTVEVANQYSRVKLILDTSLNAGKAARDVNTVSILKEMKKYDGEGKYSVAAPPQLALQAIEDVHKLAIQPAIDRCINKLRSQENTERIVLFQTQIDAIFEKKGHMGANQNIKQLIHDTIVSLRNGDIVDVEATLMTIELELDN